MTVLGERGAPTPVAATRLRAPESRMAPVDPAVLERTVTQSPLYGTYAKAVDRESAYERLAETEAGEKEPAGREPVGREPEGRAAEEGLRRGGGVGR